VPAPPAFAAGSSLVPPLPPDLLPPVSANTAARIRADVEDAAVGSGIGLVPDGAAAATADLLDGAPAAATATAAASVQDDAAEPPGIRVSKYVVHSRFLRLVWLGVPAPPGTRRTGRPNGTSFLFSS